MRTPRTKARIILATDEEKAAYAATKPVYPLHGWFTVDGQRCAVEDLRGSWSRPDPVWEIMAPEGWHFEGNGTHSLLGLTQPDLIGRAEGETLVRCTDECR